MKQLALLLAALATLIIAGCNKDDATNEQLKKAQAEAKQAADDMKDYTYAQKDAFVQKMQAQLDVLKKDLDQLSAKIEASSDKVKAEARPKLEGLREQQFQLSSQLDKVKYASESTWESVKASYKKALDRSNDAFTKARQWMSDKIAP